MTEVEDRLRKLIADSARPTGAWRSQLEGWACSGHRDGHAPELPKDAAEDAEQAMTGKAVCRRCWQDITWVPTNPQTPDSPPLRSANLDERELEELIAETERKMLGFGPTPDINEVKVGRDDPELGLEGAPRKPKNKALRAFIITHGRAPNSEELQQLMKHGRT